MAGSVVHRNGMLAGGTAQGSRGKAHRVRTRNQTRVGNLGVEVSRIHQAHGILSDPQGLFRASVK